MKYLTEANFSRRRRRDTFNVGNSMARVINEDTDVMKLSSRFDLKNSSLFKIEGGDNPRQLDNESDDDDPGQLTESSSSSSVDTFGNDETIVNEQTIEFADQYPGEGIEEENLSELFLYD